MVERGYKYRFSFRVNGEFMIDSKINSSKNAIGTLTNYVYVPKFGSSGNSSNK